MDHHRRRGRPLGKKKKTKNQNANICACSPHSPDPDPTTLANDLLETESDSDFGKDDWDPHAGTKPSPLDGEASDEHWDPEDDVDEVGSEAFNLRLVQMLADLQDNDPRDDEWKPVHKRKKMRTKAG
ncbi:hypothetical protein EI94DRAFT_1707278 [Lactarius quietus]|nr:hypothetical protein EI94DRAFT_1707278 [Lactarius quietus]